MRNYNPETISSAVQLLAKAAKIYGAPVSVTETGEISVKGREKGRFTSKALSIEEITEEINAVAEVHRTKEKNDKRRFFRVDGADPVSYVEAKAVLMARLESLPEVPEVPRLLEHDFAKRLEILAGLVGATVEEVE